MIFALFSVLLRAVTRRGLAPTRFVRRLSDVPTATHPLLAACPDHGYC
jgi:hypothetical protein